MNIAVDNGIANILKYLDIKKQDSILYLGGRIDDDNLYPLGYRKYLREKIKKLNPTKIICHSHWYASKYYSGQILTDDTKVDMIVVNCDHFQSGECQPINRGDYDYDHRVYVNVLTNKNPNMIYAMYKLSPAPSQVAISPVWFKGNYNLNNVKYFSFSRPYYVNALIDWNLKPLPDKMFCTKWGSVKINSTDGFAILNGLLAAGHKNLSIMGFSAFGMNEDTSHFTPYSLEDSRFKNLKYFDINTSENQLVEAEILKNYVEQKRINNLENYDMLSYCLNKRRKK